MFLRNKRVGISISVILFFLLVRQVNMADENGQLQLRLISALSKFEKANRLNDEQLIELLGQFLLNSQSFRKGGVGLIDSKETYIVLDEAQNKILLNHQEWKGLNSSETEVVLVDDRRVLGSFGGADPSNLKIIVFSPKEARFVNLST